MKRFLHHFFIIVLFSLVSQTKLFSDNIDPVTGNPVISGKVSDAENGEMLIGATIFVEELKTGTTTNLYGFYSISLPEGTYNISYSYMGYETIKKKITLEKGHTVHIELLPKKSTLKEVVITGEAANANVTNNEMSVVKMDIQQVKKIPALLGEVDVIKTLQLLPGVSSAGEGATGFSVRGGATDQNLILLDEAVVYNGSHLMGFFSVFNHDAIKDVKLYKGDIPAEYGGRLSSMLDIRQKDGNMKEFAGSGGIGSISSRLMLEGPIIKDKASFVVAGRRSYADIFLPLARNEDVHDNILYFWDLNAKINYIADEKNRYFISAYKGSDVLGFDGDDTDMRLSWGNSTLTFRWNHVFTEKLFSNFSYIYSHYNYLFKIDDADGLNGFEWTSHLYDHAIKADFGYYINPNNTMKFGISLMHHNIRPGKIKPTGENSIFNIINIAESNAIESGIYARNEQKIGALFTINYGLRFSMFQSMGRSRVFTYDKSDPVNYMVVDTNQYDPWEIYNTYTGWEPRIGFTYQLNEFSSIKGSYSRTFQYMHMASNATVGTPLDIWLPSSPNIKPQKAHQAGIGYFRNFLDNMLESSIEVYYKKMDNQIDFKDHAEIMGNPEIEGEMRFGEASAYGAEFLLRKQKGKFTGWVSYTYSFAKRKVESINMGEPYTAPYNKPHEVSVVGNYDLNKKISLSATWVYSTGNAATFPEGYYIYNNQVIPYFTKRNEYRYPDYHRLDLSCTWELGKLEKERFWNHSLVFSVYNAYNRHNAFSIEFMENEYGENRAYKTYLFPIIPAVTYNFNF